MYDYKLKTTTYGDACIELKPSFGKCGSLGDLPKIMAVRGKEIVEQLKDIVPGLSRVRLECWLDYDNYAENMEDYHGEVTVVVNSFVDYKAKSRFRGEVIGDDE